jgi:hypothetical protein
VTNLIFFIWAFGYWIAIAIAGAIWTTTTGQTIHDSFKLLSGLFLVWVSVGYKLFEAVEEKTEESSDSDDEEETEEDSDEEPAPNTLYIVEAPSVELALAAHRNVHLQLPVYCEIPLRKGTRLVLNSENENDSGILATVDEVAYGTQLFGDGTKTRVWLSLDRPEDYTVLDSRISGWYGNDDEMRRSTSLPMELPEPEEEPQAQGRSTSAN